MRSAMKTLLLRKGLFGSGVAVISVALMFSSVSAQPRSTASAADAGAGTGTADGGKVTAVVDAGANVGLADGGASSALAVDAGTSAYTTGQMDTIAPVATAKKVAPPPPPPTPEQVAALEALQQETEAYAKGARDYRDAVTTIIKLHYEEKKKEVLSGLDREINVEKGELRKARETAIKRLEDFITKYSGPLAQPEATPDAMYRLAALYEERARAEDASEPVEVGLKPAISLYKRVINEYPKYRELAGIYYFLGHAYNDSGRTNEAQQVWRSLVCHNKFPYPTPPDPTNPEADTVTPLPQDHDEQYWTQWRLSHPDARRFKKGVGADTIYIDPYPQTCEMLAQPALRPGEEPKYVAEVWWQIGNWEFDQLDFGGGVAKDEPTAVYDYNRAASAYLQSMKYKKPPLYGVSLYKYAWTLFKQQRYEPATKEFVHLLLYTDEQQKLTGDPGADFRSEAYTYIAGSLTNVDFTGPAADEPYIQRPDIIDTEPRPDVAEKKLHVAIERVRDPAIIPQDKPWTIEIYKALAEEFRSLTQFQNAVEVYETILKKWPMDPTAPDGQNAIAETYDQMNLTKKPNTPEFEANAAKALEARTALANYIGNTPWVDANKDNPAALHNAERLVKGGLRQAAAQHTNNGKALLVAASSSGDQRQQVDQLSRALSEYKLAALGWLGYLKQDENAPDAYESRYWLADARHQQVRIAVVLHQLSPKNFGEPTRKEIEDAKASAIDVRDSNEDDKYLDNAALFVVDESDIDRDLEYVRYDDSKGTQGTEKRVELKFDSDGAERKVVVDKVPPVVQQSIQARDEYIARVPERLDLSHNGIQYQYYIGETYFLYGQFELAKQRFEPMWKDHCGKDEYGYKAWEKLITMSNALRDAARSRELAEAEKAHSCAVSADQTAKAGLIVNPTLQEAAYVDARRKFEQACEAPVGQPCKNPNAPEKKPIWREAAGLYEAALQSAPGRDEAPEAAMNAAYAYKQVGDFNRAIELYNKFISEYGSEDRLNKLQKGDPKAKVAPDPKKYGERVKFLYTAYDALSTTYYSFFNYQRAADTYDKMAGNTRFDETNRKAAARNAIVLFAAMAQKDKMLGEYRTLNTLHPNPDEKANADFLVANYDYTQWDPKGGDTGTNRQYRLAAEESLMVFYQRNRNNPSAAKYTLTAAYQVAHSKKTAGDPQYRAWFKSTIAAWDFMKARGTTVKGPSGTVPEALSPPFVDYAAEAEFTLLDEEIADKWDRAPNRTRYCGSLDEVLGKFDKNGQRLTDGRYNTDTKTADKYDKELDRIARTYPSVEWTPAAIARQGSIWDGLRTGLYNTTTGGKDACFKLFTVQQENVLKQMENSGRDNLIDQAGEIRDRAKENWRTKKESELAGTDTLMVRKYAQAVYLGRRYNVRNQWVAKAIGKLAYYTDILGDAKMKDYVTVTSDPTDPNRKLDYKDGQYPQSRPGLTATPSPNGGALPLPVAP
jgi:hypothetical protein